MTELVSKTVHVSAVVTVGPKTIFEAKSDVDAPADEMAVLRSLRDAIDEILKRAKAGRNKGTVMVQVLDPPAADRKPS